LACRQVAPNGTVRADAGAGGPFGRTRHLRDVPGIVGKTLASAHRPASRAEAVGRVGARLGSASRQPEDGMRARPIDEGVRTERAGIASERA